MAIRGRRGLRPAAMSAERGASAVEFAIIISLLFIVLFGIIQFGIAYNRYQGLQAAAREGARVASVGDSPANVRERVRRAQSLFNQADVQVKIDSSTDNGSSWSSAICDDASGGSQCNATTPAVCTTAGIGNLVRVIATVPSSKTQYSITIPLWGSAHVKYSAQGLFRCEHAPQ
jgi:Flp pilus assembly protein TadG